MSIKKVAIFLGCILLPNLAGVIGSFFTTPRIDPWFRYLEKPFFAPPNWVFAPVWTTLFLLMGIAWFLVIKDGVRSKIVKTASIVFIIQLGFNVLWSILFFGMQRPDWAFAEIIVLLILIVLTTAYFYQINKTAAWLLAPYIGWVSFAAILNYSIWRLNL